jgi:non-canonical purine NTP pyrophosphatase (RdgB/HAM1 family)
MVLADDSGLVVPALGGAPGVHSARYAGPDATDADRIGKLLRAMAGKKGNERRARFVCVTAIAARGRALAVVSGFVEGVIGEEPRGSNGFGYDPIFQMLDINRTYGELPAEEKNRLSHRGRSFSKLIEAFPGI